MYRTTDHNVDIKLHILSEAKTHFLDLLLHLVFKMSLVAGRILQDEYLQDKCCENTIQTQ